MIDRSHLIARLHEDARKLELANAVTAESARKVLDGPVVLLTGERCGGGRMVIRKGVEES